MTKTSVREALEVKPIKHGEYYVSIAMYEGDNYLDDRYQTEQAWLHYEFGEWVYGDKYARNCLVIFIHDRR